MKTLSTGFGSSKTFNNILLWKQPNTEGVGRKVINTVSTGMNFGKDAVDFTIKNPKAAVALALGGASLQSCDPETIKPEEPQKPIIENPDPNIQDKLTAQTTEVTENNPYYDITKTDSLRNGVIFKTHNDTTFLTPEFDVNLFKDGAILPENPTELDTGTISAQIFGAIVDHDNQLKDQATISAILTDANGNQQPIADNITDAHGIEAVLDEYGMQYTLQFEVVNPHDETKIGTQDKQAATETAPPATFEQNLAALAPLIQQVHNGENIDHVIIPGTTKTYAQHQTEWASYIRHGSYESPQLLNLIAGDSEIIEVQYSEADRGHFLFKTGTFDPETGIGKAFHLLLQDRIGRHFREKFKARFGIDDTAYANVLDQNQQVHAAWVNLIRPLYEMTPELTISTDESNGKAQFDENLRKIGPFFSILLQLSPTETNRVLDEIKIAYDQAK